MSIVDFLFNGQAPKSVTTYGTSTSNIPQWISDYQQGVAAKATGIAGQPFQPFGGPRLAGFNPDQENSFQGTREAQGTFGDDFQGAINMATDAGANANSSGAAAPWLNKAGQNSYDTVSNYMDPYLDNVVNRIGELGARDLNEKLMPAINSDFIRAGQYGSTGQMNEVGKALRDTSGGILAEQNKALSEGYRTALDAANADFSRFGQIGQTAGNLSGADTDARLSAASKAGALTTLGQEGGYRDIDALRSSGSAQQEQTQSNLNLAYQDFLDQRDYQQNQLGWLNNIIKGYQAPTSTTTTNTGPLTGDQFSASPLASSVGAGLQSYQLLNGP